MLKNINMTALAVAAGVIGAALFLPVDPRLKTAFIAVGSVITAKQLPVIQQYV